MRGRPGHEINSDGSVTIHNLLKSTIAAATHELMADGIDWCLSVFVDNAGVIAFDDQHAVCFKCETHNHPSAIEPYGGAATGIGGCIRDVIGTGLAAKPIAATDVFCVANPDLKDAPAGCLPPRRVLSQVVAGVRDYGNRMGIPTLNGAVWFDDRYVGNPLVFCGVVGVMPRDRIRGAAKAGDRIIAVGGRTGRDGIHGATFSSAELTDTHADEFSHAVQIGNAVTEKMMLDAILEARDVDGGPLYHGLTDCGAGGFSSAVGEMGKDLGAMVDLERAPLKYAGLSPTEIWISEAQERMVLAVPQQNVAALQAICDRHGVEMCDLGVFGNSTEADREAHELILRYHGAEVGRLSMAFLHDGLPQTMREAIWEPPVAMHAKPSSTLQPDVGDALLDLLAHPNIASKHWIIRQYDHEVQGRTVIKPMTARHDNVVAAGPADAAVITPVLKSARGLAIANGLATGLSEDPYVMALAGIDECVRNLVCVGADPSRIAILDNFCWPSCNDPKNLGALVRAAEGCYDGAKAYRTPFISGKDSLNNQFTTEDGRTIQIPPTLLISGMGIVNDVRQCVTMDAKRAGNLLVMVGLTDARMGGSHYQMVFGSARDAGLPMVNLENGPRTAQAVSAAIARGLVRSAHDCSEGGLLVAASEMAFAGDLGLRLDLTMLPRDGDPDLIAQCFAESPSRYLLEVERGNITALDTALSGVRYAIIGEFNDTQRLMLDEASVDVDIANLRHAWTRTLDW
jgi:phosphoribosylformylglycinamidine synthase